MARRDKSLIPPEAHQPRSRLRLGITLSALASAALLATYAARDAVSQAIDEARLGLANLSEEVKEFKEAHEYRHPRLSVNLAGTKGGLGEYPSGNIEIAEPKIMAGLLGTYGPEYLPPHSGNDCLLKARVNVGTARPGTSFIDASILGLPVNPPLAGAPMTMTSSTEEAEAQIVNLAGMEVGTYEVALVGHRANASSVETATARIGVSRNGKRVTLDGEPLACDTAADAPLSPEVQPQSLAGVTPSSRARSRSSEGLSLSGL